VGIAGRLEDASRAVDMGQERSGPEATHRDSIVMHLS
jgi:hypothetical protein